MITSLQLKENMTMAEIFHPAIAEKAYYKWLDAGCPDGLSDYFWLEAEKEVYGFEKDITWGPMDESLCHQTITVY